MKPREIEEFPTPLFAEWFDPETFQEALELHVRRHGDSYWHLHRAIVKDDETLDRSTIRHWLSGTKVPRSVASLELLGRIERRYRLPEGYFKAKLPHRARSASGHVLDEIGSAERRRLAWHLPDDFNSRPASEQEEILEWVRRVIIRGSTDYRRFQAAAMKQRYAIRFPGVSYGRTEVADRDDAGDFQTGGTGETSFTDPDLFSGVIDAPPVAATVRDSQRQIGGEIQGFAFIHQATKLRSTQALRATFEQLDTLTPEVRNRLFSGLDSGPGHYSHLVDAAWLLSAKTESFDGGQTADDYRVIAELAERWGNVTLAARCHAARATMLDEYVQDSAHALAALGEAESRLGPAASISRARKDILAIARPWSSTARSRGSLERRAAKPRRGRARVHCTRSRNQRGRDR